MSSIAQALAAAREKLNAAEARQLLGHVLQKPAAWLLAHDDETLTEHQLAHYASLCARRRGGEPIAYLTGAREFYGRTFHVAPGVLIPRPETELLVDLAKSWTESRVGAGQTALRILDLGTGSGCIAISIALECTECELVAIDASEEALAIARTNAEQLGATVRIFCSDWFSMLADERFDLIVSNPPYIASGDAHLALGDLVHEPPTALSSGPDGLDAIRTIIATAPHFLRPAGSLWLEHGYDQAEAVRQLFQAAGYTDIRQHTDIAGIVRVSGGTLSQ